MNKIDASSIIKFISILLGIFAVFVVFDGYIEVKIGKQINSPYFLKSVSNQLRPFVIFNKHGNVIYDHGAMELIEKISVNIPGETKIFDDPIIVKIYPKNHLDFEPILEVLSDLGYSQKTSMDGNKTRVYTLSVASFINNTNDIIFRLEILR